MISEGDLRKLETGLSKCDGKYGVVDIHIDKWPLERLASGRDFQGEPDEVGYVLCFFDADTGSLSGVIYCMTIADIVCAARDFDYEMYTLSMHIFRDYEMAFAIARGVVCEASTS